jgi:preprotein translocase subunit SecB
MAETPPGPGNGSGPAAADPNQPPLMVRAQYVKDFSFENPNAPDVFMQGDIQPQVDINVNVEARRLPSKDYEVILTIKVDAKGKGRPVFLCELAYAGVFALGSIIPADQHQGVLLIECPRLLFPYARAIISDATREGGFPPLTLQPIDFFSLFQNQMQQQGQAQPSGPKA